MRFLVCSLCTWWCYGTLRLFLFILMHYCWAKHVFPNCEHDYYLLNPKFVHPWYLHLACVGCVEILFVVTSMLGGYVSCFESWYITNVVKSEARYKRKIERSRWVCICHHIIASRLFLFSLLEELEQCHGWSKLVSLAFDCNSV